jgi:hypothetical protein
MTNANIVVGRLESEEIPTQLKYDAAGSIYAITIDGLGEIKILVPSHLTEKAREILAQHYEESDMDWEKKET